jgi:hypothetical protein
MNIIFLLVYFNLETCFDPLKGLSSGHGIIKVLQKSNDTEGIPACRRKPYGFYNTFIIPRPEDDPLRGSKHVA